MTTNVAARTRALARVLRRKVEEVSYIQAIGCFIVPVLDGVKPNMLSPITAYWVYAPGEPGYSSVTQCSKGECDLDGLVYRVYSNET